MKLFTLIFIMVIISTIKCISVLKHSNKDYIQRIAKKLIVKYDSNYNSQLSDTELTSLLINEASYFKKKCS